MDYRNDPYNEKTGREYYPWRFISKEHKSHDLVLLKFQSGQTVVFVHTHPIDHDAQSYLGFPSAVDNAYGQRLSDSTDRWDNNLARVARQYLSENPIRRERPVAQGVDSRKPFKESDKSQYSQFSGAGSGAYRPGAFRKGNQ